MTEFKINRQTDGWADRQVDRYKYGKVGEIDIQLCR